MDRRNFGRSAFWIALAGRLSPADAGSPQSPGGLESKQAAPRSTFNEHSTAEEVTAGRCDVD